jgi:hypothetical protein
MFFYCGLVVELAKEIYRSRILFSWVPEGETVALILCQITLNFLGVSFNSLTFTRGYNFSKGVSHFVWILIPIVLAIFKFGGLAKKAKKLEEELKDKKA